MLSKAYLILYNVVQMCGWSYMLTILVPHLNLSVSKGLYGDMEWALKVFQTAAALEVIHAAIGIVRSNPVLTFVQVFSRVFVTWAIVAMFPESQLCPGFPLLLLAWIITEIIRYAFYALNLMGIESSIIVWLRYTLFIILYPMGVTGELWCIFKALQPAREQRMFCLTMPNAWNFTFDFSVFLIMMMMSYVPIFPQLYFHMFAQRKKVIGGVKKDQ